MTKDTPKMFQPFDSYVSDGRIVIITKEYSFIHGEDVIAENFMSIERAKQIAFDLQYAINKAEEINQ